MQNIKNFQMVTPSSEMLLAYQNPDGEIQLFFQSKEGRCWYVCQSEFADDTVKIQYSSDGVITGIVDAPVPQRGNVYAVSMLWPIDCSVAEIAVTDYPTGVALDGT